MGQNIRGENCEERNKEWLRRIHMNYFDFDELTVADQALEYNMGFILSDADYPALFYKGIQEHYAWVETVLRENGIEISTFIDI